MSIIIKDNKELKKGNKKLLKDNKNMDKKLRMVLNQNDILYDKQEYLCDKFDDVCNYRVVEGKKNENNMLFIIKNNDDGDYDYTVKRVMRKSACQGLADHKVRYPDMKILLRLDYSPNSMNLWHRIRDALDDKIDCNRCKFNLKDDYTEDELIEDIMEIHNERFNY